jgi:hypothetical protein
MFWIMHWYHLTSAESAVVLRTFEQGNPIQMQSCSTSAACSMMIPACCNATMQRMRPGSRRQIRTKPTF